MEKKLMESFNGNKIGNTLYMMDNSTRKNFSMDMENLKSQVESMLVNFLTEKNRDKATTTLKVG